MKQFLRLTRFILPIFIAIAVLYFFRENTLAFAKSSLPSDWSQFIYDKLPNFSDTSQDGEVLAQDLVKNGIRIVRYILGAVAVLMGILYGFSMIFNQGNDEVITKQKKNFLWLVIGFLILLISENIAYIFNPDTAEVNRIIDFAAANDQLRDVLNYLKWLFGSIIVLMMVISSIRFITAQGQDEIITEQKRNITWTIIGMLTILLADNIVKSVYHLKSPDATGDATVADPENLIEQIASVIRLILVFVGPAAILFTIYAGFMYITAMENDDQAEKAKKMIIGGLTAIVIIYASSALVNTVVTTIFT